MNYEGSAWVAYDRQFHTEALARKDLNWWATNARLYFEVQPTTRSLHSYTPLYAASHSTIHINRYRVLPKGHDTGKWHRITDLSYPPGKSVNDGIDPELCSLHYTSVDDVAVVTAELCVSQFIHTIAYCWVLLDIEWKGQVFADPMLPFGLQCHSRSRHIGMVLKISGDHLPGCFITWTILLFSAQ